MGLFNLFLLRNFATTRKADEFFGKGAREEYARLYSQSINLSKGVSGTEAFNEYQKNRPRQLEDFINLKDKKDKAKMTSPYWEKLKELENSKVGAGIITSLKDTDTLKESQKLYNEDIEKINALIKKVPLEIKLDRLPGMLHISKQEALEAIKGHQTQVRSQLETYLNGEFTADVKTETTVTSDEQIAKMKMEMLQALDSSHAEQLKQFEETCNKSLNDICQQIQTETDRITYLAGMYDYANDTKYGALQDRNLKEFLSEMAKKKNEELKKQGVSIPAVSINYDTESHDFSFKGIAIEDLPILQTLSGTDLNIKKTPEGTVELSMKLPSFLGGIIYYNSPHENEFYDLLSMAEAVKSCGYEYITMSIKTPDPEKEEETARKMYEACISAGFDPTHITININGKKQKILGGTREAPALFDNHPQRHGKTQEIAARKKEEKDKPGQFKNIDEKSLEYSQYKEELKKVRDLVVDKNEPDMGQQLKV